MKYIILLLFSIGLNAQTFDFSCVFEGININLEFPSTSSSSKGISTKIFAKTSDIIPDFDFWHVSGYSIGRELSIAKIGDSKFNWSERYASGRFSDIRKPKLMPGRYVINDSLSCNGCTTDYPEAQFYFNAYGEFDVTEDTKNITLNGETNYGLLTISHSDDFELDRTPSLYYISLTGESHGLGGLTYSEEFSMYYQFIPEDVINRVTIRYNNGQVVNIPLDVESLNRTHVELISESGYLTNYIVNNENVSIEASNETNEFKERGTIQFIGNPTPGLYPTSVQGDSVSRWLYEDFLYETISVTIHGSNSNTGTRGWYSSTDQSFDEFNYLRFEDVEYGIYGVYMNSGIGGLFDSNIEMYGFLTNPIDLNEDIVLFNSYEGLNVSTVLISVEDNNYDEVILVYKTDYENTSTPINTTIQNGELFHYSFVKTQPQWGPVQGIDIIAYRNGEEVTRREVNNFNFINNVHYNFTLEEE